jgi:ankyrin repeat protein
MGNHMDKATELRSAAEANEGSRAKAVLAGLAAAEKREVLLATDKDGYSALDWAASKNSKESIAVMLEGLSSEEKRDVLLTMLEGLDA